MNEIQKRGFEYGVQHFVAQKEGSLTEVLFTNLDLSPERAAELIELGSVYVENHRTSDLSFPISTGTYLRVHTKPRRYPLETFRPQFQIIEEHPDFVILLKPSGLPVHGTVDNLRENFQALAEGQLQQKLFVTHRLDVPTAGLILFAKNPQAQSDFNQMLKDKKVIKKYLARLVGQSPSVGTWIHYMKPSPRAPKEVSLTMLGPDWQKCELEILKQTPVTKNIFEVEIHLLTGRTHQIRAQSSAMGCPVEFDQAYGAEAAHPSGGEVISLFAQELQFEWKQKRFFFRKEKHWSSEKPDYPLA